MILRITSVDTETVVAEINGDLCGYFARKTARLFDSCVRNGARRIVIDLAKCLSIDSLGVALLKDLSSLELSVVSMGGSIRETCRAEGFLLGETGQSSSVEAALGSLKVKRASSQQLVLCNFSKHNLVSYLASAHNRS